MTIKPAIIFDLGAVLIDWNPRYLYRQLFADEAAMEAFFAETELLKWNAKQDEGHPFAEAVTELSRQFPHHESYIRAFHERWEEMMPSAIAATVEILAELRAQNYELYALSNWSAETYPIAYRRFEFLQWFRAVVLSGEVKICKPDPRIYTYLLKIIGRPASECIFIDDSLANYQAAIELGLQAIHFQSPEQLRAALQARAISVLPAA
ncbi:MAG: HAD family phosphatase [Blastocatellia bacterium]